MTTHTKAVGTRAEVWHGSARHTSGGLTKKHLMKNKHGRIVSRRKHASGKRTIKRLFALGYKPHKGTFKAFHRSSSHRRSSSKKRRHTRRRRGGFAEGVQSNLPRMNPAHITSSNPPTTVVSHPK
jgi:hypothetical protein